MTTLADLISQVVNAPPTPRQSLGPVLPQRPQYQSDIGALLRDPRTRPSLADMAQFTAAQRQALLARGSEARGSEALNGNAQDQMAGAFAPQPRASFDNGRYPGADALEATGLPQLRRGIQHETNSVMAGRDYERSANEASAATPELAMGGLGLLGMLGGGEGMRAPRELPRMQAEAPQGYVSLYHGTPEQFPASQIRPSENGLSGPGIYTSISRDDALSYGNNIYRHDAPVDRFIDVSEFNRRNALNRNGAQTAQELANEGYLGTRDGNTHTLWQNPATLSADAGSQAGAAANALGAGGSAGRVNPRARLLDSAVGEPVTPLPVNATPFPDFGSVPPVRVYRGGDLSGQFWTGELPTARAHSRVLADGEPVLHESTLDPTGFGSAEMTPEMLADYRRYGAARSVDPFVMEQLRRAESENLPGIVLDNVPDMPTFAPERQYIVRDTSRLSGTAPYNSEPATRLSVNPTRELGRAADGSVLPVRPPQPFRQSMVGGSADLREAAQAAPSVGARGARQFEAAQSPDGFRAYNFTSAETPYQVIMEPHDGGNRIAVGFMRTDQQGSYRGWQASGDRSPFQAAAVYRNVVDAARQDALTHGAGEYTFSGYTNAQRSLYSTPAALRALEPPPGYRLLTDGTPRWERISSAPNAPEAGQAGGRWARATNAQGQIDVSQFMPVRDLPAASSRAPQVGVETVRLSDLNATHGHLGASSEPPATYLKAHDNGADLPEVYRAPDGQMYLIDGHHRALALMDRGDTTMRARITGTPASAPDGSASGADIPRRSNAQDGRQQPRTRGAFFRGTH